MKTICPLFRSSDLILALYRMELVLERTFQVRATLSRDQLHDLRGLTRRIRQRRHQLANLQRPWLS